MVRWLRELGHDIFWIAEQQPSSVDGVVAETAQQRDAVLLTKDLGFGKMWARQLRPLPGVILLRLGDDAVAVELACLQQLWPKIQPACTGAIVVVQPGRIRVREMGSERE